MKEAAELIECARTIHAWQQARGFSNAQMIREYPGLGSDKTYSRIRDGHTEDYDVEQQLANYRSVLAVIEAIGGGAAAETLYDDLGIVLQVRRAVVDVMKSTGNARCVVIQGPSGIGKTVALRIVCGRYGARCLIVEASDVWRDNPSALLGAILRTLGQADLPPGRVERLETVQEKLSTGTRCLFIDEAHHLGPHCLNTIKTLVNTTPGQVVLVAIPTLWGRLETQAFQEARQLTTNRLSERVRLDLCEADIVRYLRHIFPQAADADLKAGAKVIRPAAIGAGNMAFVRDVAREAAKLSGDSQPDAKLFADAVAAVARRR
jgi:type II secretory pathway predicted ATPase ExeA